MSEIEALDIVSKMVLNKMKTRPAMITRWGQVLNMLYEEYPEFRPTQDAPDLGESAESDSESKPAPKRVI